MPSASCAVVILIIIIVTINFCLGIHRRDDKRVGEERGPLGVSDAQAESRGGQKNRERTTTKKMASPSASPTGSPGPGSRSDRGRKSSTPGPSDGYGSPYDTSTPLPKILWSLQVPLCITHASRPAASPFIVSVPRFSYLALLLPRLTAYYGLPCSSFHHEEIQLRNLAVGLLVDLYQPATLPWPLVVGDGPEWDIADTFTNSAKEADFVRNGNAKQIMSLSKAHSTALWNAVQDSKWPSFSGPSIWTRFCRYVQMGESSHANVMWREKKK